MKRITYILAMLLQAFVVLNCAKKEPTPPTTETGYNLSALHTNGRWIVDDNGAKMILRGVNIPSMEWTAPGDHMLASVEYMINEWGCNLLRIPLSQDRWYGYGPEQNDSGAAYQALVQKIVALGDEKGAYIWLDLHWSDGAQWGANIGQHKMPDENSITFLRDLATAYKNHPAVLFGLYNEPHDISWDLWRNGGDYTENYDRSGEAVTLTYRAVGHQELYNVVRSTGAENIVIAAGIDWGYDLSGILNGYALDGINIAYDTHPYPWKDKNWDGKWGDVGKAYPIIVGEWGLTKEEPGHQQYGVDITAYMRRHTFCWTAWSLHPSAGPSLIKDWNYAPTWFGELVIKELSEPVSMPE